MIEKGQYLINWNGQKINRFDIRTLLDSSSFRNDDDQNLDKNNNLDEIRYKDFASSPYLYDGKNDKEKADNNVI